MFVRNYEIVTVAEIARNEEEMLFFSFSSFVALFLNLFSLFLNFSFVIASLFKKVLFQF